MSALQECTLARLYTEKKEAAEDCIVSSVLFHSQTRNHIMTSHEILNQVLHRENSTQGGRIHQWKELKRDINGSKSMRKTQMKKYTNPPTSVMM